MDEPFELPVHYKGEEQLFTARLMIRGFTHYFIVLIGTVEVIYERDDEGCYRAVIRDADRVPELPPYALLEAIGNKIRSILE